MEHLEKFRYASRDHVILLILWRTGIRNGSILEEYIRDNDERPTYLKCYREGPFESSKTKRLLKELVEVDVLRDEEQER